MLFSDLQDSITIYVSTKNDENKQEHIRIYLSRVYLQSTRAIKTIQVGHMLDNDYVCLIPYKRVDAHGREYMPAFDWERLPIDDRRQKYWTVKPNSQVYIGLLDEPAIIPNEQYTSIMDITKKYEGKSFKLTNFDDFTQGSPEIWHAAIGGV